eukprot:116892-Rhodomonas_salina.2
MRRRRGGGGGRVPLRSPCREPRGASSAPTDSAPVARWRGSGGAAAALSGWSSNLFFFSGDCSCTDRAGAGVSWVADRSGSASAAGGATGVRSASAAACAPSCSTRNDGFSLSALHQDLPDLPSG